MRWLVTLLLAAPVSSLMFCASSASTAFTVDDVLVRPETATGFWREHDLAITIRFSSEDEPDRQITLLRGAKGAGARIVEAIGRPVAEQLETARDIKSIRLTSYNVDDDPVVTSLVDSFMALRVSPVPSTELYLHPRTITIWSTTRAGSAQWFLTIAPDHPTAVWGEKDHPNDLAAWAVRVETAVRQRSNG